MVLITSCPASSSKEFAVQVCNFFTTTLVLSSNSFEDIYVYKSALFYLFQKNAWLSLRFVFFVCVFLVCRGIYRRIKLRLNATLSLKALPPKISLHYHLNFSGFHGSLSAQNQLVYFQQNKESKKWIWSAFTFKSNRLKIELWHRAGQLSIDHSKRFLIPSQLINFSYILACAIILKPW